MFKKFNILLLYLVVLSSLSYVSIGQTSWSQEANQGGFWIKKVVSDTTIATGQPFSYTIYYSLPAGAQNVTITDNLPSGVMFLSASNNNACGTPTVSSPAVNQMGGTYSLNWASVPNACTGSFTIQVAFPNGITCNGATVRNNVCLTGILNNKTYEFCTGYVVTKALATNPWHINKYPIGLAWQGGYCPYVSGSDTITYQICVYKDVGTTGQLNLVNGIVYDTLPAGAMLVNSNCGATQSGNIITWNIGNLSATQQYNTVCCQFGVYYPSSQFPSGTNISNSAILTGQLGSANQPCDTISIPSNQTCVHLASLTQGSITKWVYTNRQPGCSGQYLIYVCNTGTTQLPITVTDTLPSQLTGYSLGANNINANLSGNIITATDTLAQGACGYVYINFTIPSNATIGSTITNCVHMTAPGLNPLQYCNSFVVDSTAPKPCLWKEVCNKQTSYTPGSTLRYRLRIQNIGGLDLTGATITDQLNPNLEYIGNPSYYTTNTWNTPCSSNSNWSGVNLSYNPGTNQVNISLPNIPATCQNFFYSNCGMYGTSGVPYYFIEFDVKVRDTSALGNIPNAFTINGGNLGNSSFTSNTDYILVAGVTGYNLQKGVKKHNAPNYANSANVAAGSIVDYQLELNSSGSVALRYVTFADLLPKDAVAGDSKILQACSSRGSQFDVTYNGFISSSPTISQWNNPFNTGLANVNNLQPVGSPGLAFSIGCGSGGTWSTNWTTGDKNLAAHFGSNAIPSSATIEFSANVSSNAPKQSSACNTFAASGFTKHLIQSSITSFQLAGQTESGPTCITIDSTLDENPCLDSLIRLSAKCEKQDQNGNWIYSVTMNAISCVPGTISLNSPDGNFTPSSFNISSNPWTINTNFTHTGSNNPIKIYYTISCNNTKCTDSLMLKLPSCGEDTTGCFDIIRPPQIKCIGENAAGNVEYAIQVTATSCTPATLLINSPDGNFTTNTFSLTSSPWTINTTFVNTSSNNPIMIYYSLLCKGMVCKDSIKLKLPDCPSDSSLDDCCLNFIHNIKETKISWLPNGFVGLSGTIVAGPVNVKKFSATIVSAQIKKPNYPNWQRIFGDIIGGSLIVAPSAGPQLLSVYSREAIWGPGECINWNNGANYYLKMLFPSISFKTDSLKFAIRYTFTDCECNTCDTLVWYTVRRKSIIIPWDHVNLPKNIIEKGENKDISLSEPPSQTSLIMDDSENGSLWIVNPDDPDNNITVVGVEINSPEIGLNSISYNTQQGILQGNIGYIDLLVNKGETSEIKINFNNEQNIKQFKVYVRYFYKLDDIEDILTTEPIEYTARAPITEFDEMGIDETTKPENVFTYALYILNSNEYEENIYALSIKPIGNEKILAIGPTQSINGQTYVIPYLQEDGSYVVTVPANGTNGIDAELKSKPIFITLSGIDENNSEIEFTTYDINMQIISTGKLKLTNPISKVEQNEYNYNSNGYLDQIYPNPAKNTATISFTVNNYTENVTLSIFDLQGKEIMKIIKNQSFDSGTYIKNIDISTLPSGNYIVTLKVNDELISKPLTIVR